MRKSRNIGYRADFFNLMDGAVKNIKLQLSYAIGIDIRSMLAIEYFYDVLLPHAGMGVKHLFRKIKRCLVLSKRVQPCQVVQGHRIDKGAVTIEDEGAKREIWNCQHEGITRHHIKWRGQFGREKCGSSQFETAEGGADSGRIGGRVPSSIFLMTAFLRSSASHLLSAAFPFS